MPQSIKQVSSLAGFQKLCNKGSVLQTKAPLHSTAQGEEQKARSAQ